VESFDALVRNPPLPAWIKTTLYTGKLMRAQSESRFLTVQRAGTWIAETDALEKAGRIRKGHSIEGRGQGEQDRECSNLGSAAC